MSVTEIPPMTHPLSKHWSQPPTSAILLDDKHALMSEVTFKALAEYSATIPTGAYEGKMWRRHDGIYESGFGGVARHDKASCPWLLCWYVPGKDADHVAIDYRTILLID